MNIRTVRELAKIMETYDLTCLDFCEGEDKLHLERAACGPVAPAVLSAALASAEGPGETLPKIAPETGDDLGMDFSDVQPVTAPMVGVFYAAPAPGKPPFVEVGSRVKQGDVLCILEAMKLMNEITAERDGQIVDICVADGDVVEFGQTLFKLY
ncbi:MAG: acetyl-CoA carboxylase biotin carboxyl carrier protein [Firmicutes bacterium]|nr:acetyl-CoA carboxylase biotin carboxyl carrier protein [Bacillota bacterium]